MASRPLRMFPLEELLELDELDELELEDVEELELLELDTPPSKLLAPQAARQAENRAKAQAPLGKRVNTLMSKVGIRFSRCR